MFVVGGFVGVAITLAILRTQLEKAEKFEDTISGDIVLKLGEEKKLVNTLVDNATFSCEKCSLEKLGYEDAGKVEGFHVNPPDRIRHMFQQPTCFDSLRIECECDPSLL